jgi:hypothetical protein
VLYFWGLCVLCFCILVVKDSAWPKVSSIIRVEKEESVVVFSLTGRCVSPKEAEDCTQHNSERLDFWDSLLLRSSGFHRFEKSQEHYLDCEFSFLNRIQY